MAITDSDTLATGNATLIILTARIVTVVAICLSLYQLYTAGIAALTALVQRSIHLGAILVLTFLLKPPFDRARKDRLSLWVVMDWILVAASIYCTAYICINLTAIFERQGDWLAADRIVSIVGTILVLEACRRVIGVIMTGICLLAMIYAYFGPYMPELIIHKGYSIERIATTLWLTTEGIFGLPIGVAATFVFVFVLFGAFLETTGGGAFFIELAYALTGHTAMGHEVHVSTGICAVTVGGVSPEPSGTAAVTPDAQATPGASKPADTAISPDAETEAAAAENPSGEQDIGGNVLLWAGGGVLLLLLIAVIVLLIILAKQKKRGQESPAGAEEPPPSPDDGDADIAETVDISKE